MSAHDMAVGAATLKRLRQSRGWSLAATARALTATAARLGQPLSASVASVQRTVARWESSATPLRPSERYQLLLAHLYAHTPAGDIALGPGSDFAELLHAMAHLGESTTRLHELRTLLLHTATNNGASLLALLSPATRGALTAALADPARTDEQLLTHLDTAVTQVNDRVGALPFARLQLLLAPVVDSCRQLIAGAVPDHLRPGLAATATRAYTLAGRLAFENRDDDASRTLYAAATRTADALPTWQRATVHMSRALVTLYSTDGLDAARALVDAAVRDARQGDSPVIRARAHALQSEIAARSGSQRHARTALSLAWYDMDNADPDSDPSSSSFSPAHLRGFEGLSELYVGNPATAHDFFARSAQSLTTSRTQVQRAIITTDQALASIRLGDPHNAADLLHTCIDATSRTGGRVPMLRLRRARRELSPWRHEAFLADLDDHLLDTLGR
jgi:transcriptional regulator with XRE-family HTH domain